VFEGEPKFNPGFLELDNVVPCHRTSDRDRRATRMAMAMRAADNLIAALAGERPPNLL
jgi:gluconate 2-dehydrogenase